MSCHDCQVSSFSGHKVYRDQDLALGVTVKVDTIFLSRQWELICVRLGEVKAERIYAFGFFRIGSKRACPEPFSLGSSLSKESRLSSGAITRPSGLVSGMYHYLGVEQITTGSYNPRDNAIVERFMHTLGHMLRIASNEEYNNLKDYLQCIAFAHHCTYSSVIGCTPFESGHGLRARTVAEARMAIPKLQLLEEEADGSLTAQAWDKSLPKKVLELNLLLAWRQWLKLILNGIVG